MLVPAAAHFFLGVPPYGIRCEVGGGGQVGRIPEQEPLAIISTHHPWYQKFPRVPPPRGGGVWGLGSCYPRPCTGFPTIVGVLPPPLMRGQISPSPRGRNSRPSLPMIPISPLLCACPRSDGAGNAAVSTLSPVPYPITPSGVIRSVCRYSIVFVVVVVVALKILTLHTSYHQLPPPNQNIGFISCFTCPI